MEMGREEYGQLRVGRSGLPDEKAKVVSHASRRALIVIDVQNDYISGKLPIEFPPVELSLPNIGTAMDAAKAAGLPVVVVKCAAGMGPIYGKGYPGAELHATVCSRGWDHHILKNLPSAFAGTDLEDWLKERRVDTLPSGRLHDTQLRSVDGGARAACRVRGGDSKRRHRLDFLCKPGWVGQRG